LDDVYIMSVCPYPGICNNLPLKASGYVDIKLSAHDAFVE